MGREIFPNMIGKVVWDWICSAPKRPFIQRSYDELVALVNSDKTKDIKTLKKIKEELGHRKRLKTSKNKELVYLIETKVKLLIENLEAAGCDHEKTSPENKKWQRETHQSKDCKENMYKNKTGNARDQNTMPYVSEEQDKNKTDKKETEEVEENKDLEIKKIPASQSAVTTENGIVTISRDQFTDISQVDLSRKTYNALRRNGLEDASKLQCMSNEEILMLKGIGQKGLDEIRKAIPLQKSVDDHKSEVECNLTPQKAMDAKNQDNRDIEPDGKVESSGIEVDKQELERKDTDLSNLAMIETFSTYKEEIEYLNEAIHADYKDQCMVAAINNEREFSFLLKRMSGMTLEAIGQQSGVTRERVRQVIKKTSKKLGIDDGKLCNMSKKRRKNNNELKLREQLDSDLGNQKLISKMTRIEWKKVNGREMSLKDRIEMLREIYVPIPANELQDHLAIIEEGKGQYGGKRYWDDIVILRLLINMVAIKNGKPGVMPRQIELPPLVSKYIQKRGGQRRVAQLLGISYEGPIGSRNRNYWTESRITEAIKDTQEYFGLPEDMMPEQAQIIVWLGLDKNEDTKGPSCIAAIKKDGGWNQYCEAKGYKQYKEQNDKGKKEIDSRILLTLWNRNNFINEEAEFMDVFTEFLGEFWNSQSDPRRYISLVNNACKVAKSIGEYSEVIDTEQRKEIVCKAIGMSPGIDGLQLQDEESDTVDVDRFVDLLF
jgi:hypothetical protein